MATGATQDDLLARIDDLEELTKTVLQALVELQDALNERDDTGRKPVRLKRQTKDKLRKLLGEHHGLPGLFTGH